MNEREEPLTEHLDEMTGLLYVDGQLDRARAQEVSAHASLCEKCRTLLRALEHESRLLTRAMFEEEEPLPARLAVAPGKRGSSSQWIWAGVFSFAAMGLYALYTGYIQPWTRQLEQAGFGGTNLLGLLVFQGAFWKGWQSMLSLIEVLAMLSLAGFGLALVRRRLRRGSALALVFTGLCTVLAVPSVASAADCRHADNVTVNKDEVIKNDLYAQANHIRLDGTVQGDVFAFANEFDMRGHVTGDIICFCRILRVNGQVDGNVRDFANSLQITGTVGRNVTSFTEGLDLDAGGKIGGGLTAFTDNLVLDGAIGRDLLTFATRASLSGRVGGDLTVQAHDLFIASTGEVRGKAKFKGDRMAEVSPQAKLASPLVFEKFEHKPDYSSPKFYIWRAIFIAAVLLFGMVLFLLMPKFASEAVGSGERLGPALGLGLLVFFGVPIAAIVACITIVGLALGISACILWFAMLYFSQLVVGGLLGRWILGPTSAIWPLIGRMALGFFLLRLVFTVPYIGGWAKLAVIIWGFGAVSLALYQRFQPKIIAGVAPVPQPA